MRDAAAGAQPPTPTAARRSRFFEGPMLDGSAFSVPHRSANLRLRPSRLARATLRSSCGELVFFYGTLMAGSTAGGAPGIDDKLTYIGPRIHPGALFDLGLYPAAVPAPEGRVWGEVYEMSDAPTVLAALDEIEGYRHDDPDRSLYIERRPTSCCPTAASARAWVYFYNAPLGRAPRIASGDYLEHVKVR